jgi:hypothetical protein
MELFILIFTIVLRFIAMVAPTFIILVIFRFIVIEFVWPFALPLISFIIKFIIILLVFILLALSFFILLLISVFLLTNQVSIIRLP